MPKPLHVTLPHNLSQAEAQRRIEEGLARVRPQVLQYVSSLEDRWNGNQLDFTLTAVKQTIIGRIVVEADHVAVDLDLPWLLATIANKLRNQIERKGDTMLRLPKA
jgi:hypothetical protein